MEREKISKVVADFRALSSGMRLTYLKPWMGVNRFGEMSVTNMGTDSVQRSGAGLRATGGRIRMRFLKKD